MLVLCPSRSCMIDKTSKSVVYTNNICPVIMKSGQGYNIVANKDKLLPTYFTEVYNE
jgi:hypothetical protein